MSDDAPEKTPVARKRQEITGFNLPEGHPSRCVVTIRRTGLQCKKPAIQGATVCFTHTGATLLRRRTAAKNVINREALKWTAKYAGDRQSFDAVEELTQLVLEVRAFKNFLGARLNKLEEENWRYEHEKAGEQLRAEVELYERALDRSGKFLTSMIRLNIDDRLAKISEARVTRIRTALVSVLDGLELTPEQQRRASGLLTKAFRGLVGE